MAEQDTVTAGELLEQQLCTPQCLLAINEASKDCSCRCGGRYHGDLINADLPKPAGPWWEDAKPCYPADELARIYVDQGRIDKFNRWWKTQKSAGQASVWVRRESSKNWSVIGDTWTADKWTVSVDTACWANAMFTMLLHAGRAKWVETWPIDRPRVDPGHFALFGFNSREEALQVAAVTRECLFDNWFGANQHVVQLRDHYDLDHVNVLLPEPEGGAS